MITTAKNSLAILNAKAPYSNTSGKDALDIALIFGSFEQSVSLFFQGEGVRQLMSGQDGAIISVKDYLKTFAAFEFYDINEVYVCQASVEERNLSADFHIENLQILSREAFAHKLTTHQTILRF